MSARVGAVVVAKLEDLLHYLPDGAERIELAPLDLVEEPLQLRVALDGLLEMGLRAAGRHGKDLAGEVLAPPLVQPPVGLEERAVLLDLLPQERDVLVARRLG